MRCPQTRFLIPAIVSAVAAGPVAVAQPWSFTRIADSNSTVPGAGASFQRFGIPSVRNGVVAFSGFRDFPNPTTAGLYTGSGGPLTIIADHTTPAPGGSGNLFTGFGFVSNSWPSMSGSDIAFHGEVLGAVVPTGIYHHHGGGLAKVVDYQTPVPNGAGGNFSIMWQPSVENGRVVFPGWEAGEAQRGVYSWQSGALSIVADKSTPIPGGSGNFTNFTGGSLDDNHVMFDAEGAGGYNGLFLADPSGSISRLYDTNTVVPGGNGGTFTGLGGAFGGGRVAFYGLGGGQEGIYSDVSGRLEALADLSTPVPGFPGQSFSGFGFVAIDDGVVAFTGLAPGAFLGVFSTHGGSLGKVLANGDLLDGRIVADAFIGGQSLDGDSIAISVIFTNGTRGIYMATIPAPGTALLLACGIGAATRRRRS